MHVVWVARHDIAFLDELAATVALTCSFPLKFSAINDPTKLSLFLHLVAPQDVVNRGNRPNRLDGNDYSRKENSGLVRELARVENFDC
jgi:hypothetical protein